MSDILEPIADIKEEAARIIEAAQSEGVLLRLLGGLAIYLQCPSTHTDERLIRSYGDMDFVTLGKWSAKTKTLFAKLGYTGNKTFNALHGHQRLLFFDEKHERHIDIFIDRMQMCHNLDFRSRLLIANSTISLSDLLITKLQIVEINEKDIKDTIALFVDHEVSSSEQDISASYIASLTSNDWGLYKTLTLNLNKLRAFAVQDNFPAFVTERVDTLTTAIESSPKSMGWKARSMVGERVRWYELPEEAHQ
jgi:hypothetical protein